MGQPTPDERSCWRCGQPLGANASGCWWCEWYALSLKRRGMLVLLALLLSACGPGAMDFPGVLPNLANARTPDDVRAWMGEPCAVQENAALPLGEDWLYCVERVEVPPPEWRLSPACVPGCPSLVVHFSMGRYVGETPPR